MRRFLSRKLMVALGGTTVVVLSNLGVPEDVAANITEGVIWIAGTYLLVQGADDAVKEWRAR